MSDLTDSLELWFGTEANDVPDAAQNADPSFTDFIGGLLRETGTPSDGDGIVWVAANSRWEFQPAGGGGSTYTTNYNCSADNQLLTERWLNFIANGTGSGAPTLFTQETYITQPDDGTVLKFHMRCRVDPGNVTIRLYRNFATAGNDYDDDTQSFSAATGGGFEAEFSFSNSDFNKGDRSEERL